MVYMVPMVPMVPMGQPFGEIDVVEMEELAEHNQGEPEENMNNTEQDVRMPP